MASREAAGREASPTAGVIDSQSVKTTGNRGPRGFDAGKKIKGRKRHIVTDTQSHLLGLIVHEASIEERRPLRPCFDPFALSLAAPYLCRWWLCRDKLRKALKRIGEWTIEIIKRSDTAHGFEVLPRRWVGKSFAWLVLRRLAKDFEATIASAAPGRSSRTSEPSAGDSQSLRSNAIITSRTLSCPSSR